jgi:DUF1680 family protein
VPYVSSFCCPPNLVRTIAESAGYAYAKSDDAIWVNLYGGSMLATELPGGQKINLTQETDYPWNGRIRIVINECGTNKFTLKMRIPGWANDASVRINDRPVNSTDEGQSLLTSAPTGYFELRRTWHAGDFVDLDLPMPVRLMEANPLVEEDVNQLAVQRGPVVYCMESLDLPPDTKLSDVLIPADIQLAARYDRRLLGGVAVLEGQALTRLAGDWTGKLYRDFQSANLKPVKVRFIPYSVWANRGPAEMTVWVPRSDQ